MRMTRRGWGAAAAGLFLVVLGLGLERPLLLVGGALVGAWLVGYAFAYVSAVDGALDDLEVEQGVERDRVVTDRQLAATLGASLSALTPVHLAVESRPPTGASINAGGPTRIELPPGAEAARTTYLVKWPHAGQYSFESPVVTATDALGLFETRAASGPEATLTVAPRAPRDVHVGAGGEATTAAYGEHPGDRPGAGLDPAELRQYQPGDPAARIDWKATARLAEPYVREFDRETDRRTLLVLDHRGTTALGPAGETKLAYLREVALAVLESARAMNDPLACYTVGDDGLTGQWQPETDRPHYGHIERHLAGLEPTATDGTRSSDQETSPATAARLAGRLAAADSAFGLTLRPYFEHTEPYFERVSGDPLYEAVRTARQRIRGPVWTVLLTDDADPARLRQAVGLARRGEGRVLVFLAPTVLFEPGGLADLEGAYDRYVAFEELRRSLARSDRVIAYEVAPGGRVGAVLAAGRERARRGRPVEGA